MRFSCPVEGCDKAYATSMGIYQHKRSKHPWLINQRAWRGQKCTPLAAPELGPMRLLRARLVALAGSALPGEEGGPLGDRASRLHSSPSFHRIIPPRLSARRA